MDVTLEISAPLPAGDVLEGVETLISGTTLHIRELAGIWHENQPERVRKMRCCEVCDVAARRAARRVHASEPCTWRVSWRKYRCTVLLHVHVYVCQPAHLFRAGGGEASQHPERLLRRCLKVPPAIAAVSLRSGDR